MFDFFDIHKSCVRFTGINSSSQKDVFIWLLSLLFEILPSFARAYFPWVWKWHEFACVIKNWHGIKLMLTSYSGCWCHRDLLTMLRAPCHTFLTLLSSLNETQGRLNNPDKIRNTSPSNTKFGVSTMTHKILLLPLIQWFETLVVPTNSNKAWLTTNITVSIEKKRHFV